MATKENTDKKIGDTHPIGHLLDEWVEWVKDEDKGELEIEYDEDEDVFNVTRGGLEAVVFTSDIDEAFYGESQAVFVESEIGEPPEMLDLSQTLKFSGNELVLSRISLSDRDSKTLLLVEAAIPMASIQTHTFDLMVREVATIGRDLRKHLSSVLKTDDEDDDEDDED
jgi:hypothetical protein